MQTFYKICTALVIIGGINWGLYGLFGFDLVAWLCGGSMTMWARGIYIIIGAAAICAIPGLFQKNAAD